MNTQYSQEIKEYLQHKEVQERILRSIEEARSKATVTISRAAKLFGFSESQLREWEKRGLLSTERQALSPEARGHRQYSPAELEKLAIIRELMDNQGYLPGDIPTDVDEIWRSLSQTDGQYPLKAGDGRVGYAMEADSMHIDQRILHLRDEAFWRFYVSHALRLSLMLICEDIIVKRASLILPLHQEEIFASAPNSLENVSEVLIKDIGEVGESLVGWLGQSRSFYTFLTQKPSFEYPTDFRILQLKAKEEAVPCDNTLVVLPREDATLLTLSEPVVKIVRRLLTPLYDKSLNWQEYLGVGMRDILDPLIDFNSNTGLVDTILTGLAERVVRLGGKRKEDESQNRWRFCCILVPNNPQLPLQQRSLVVRAKSKEAPVAYKLGTTLVSPDVDVISVSLRAFEGGRIIYRHRVTKEDTSIANLDDEKPIGSAIAVPIGGEDGAPVAVLYIVSAEPDAFSQEDQSILRMIGRMVEELLLTYRTRIQATESFTSLIRNSSIVDPTYAVFASEDQFINDVETLLKPILKQAGRREDEGVLLADDEVRARLGQLANNVVSFIAIDIDKLTSLANKHGDRMTKNLSKAVGERTQAQLRVLFTNSADCKLYHAYADRFYLMLKGITLENAREKAKLLMQNLQGEYQVDALRSAVEPPSLSESTLISTHITVRLGVSSYPYMHLARVLRRYPAETAVASMTALISRSLDAILTVGKDEKGDVIITWDPQIWGFRRL